MALRIDPRDFAAPGGIVSGLDDLGAAVVRALNRRTERKYESEAAAKKAAADEGRFAAQLRGQKDLQTQQDEAAMARAKLAEAGDTGRNLVTQGRQAFSSFADNASEVLRGGMTAFGKAFSGGKDSTSKDGVLAEEKELNDAIRDIELQAVKEYPAVDQSAFDPMGVRSISDAEALAAEIKVANEAMNKGRADARARGAAARGYEYKDGRVRRPVATPTTTTLPPTTKPAAPAASLAAKYRAKFPNTPAGKLDDAALEKLLTERKWTGE